VIVVCNSSPLITLGKLGLLEMLSRLFAEVHVVSEVFHEVTVAGVGRPGAEAVRMASWIRKHENPDPGLLEIWEQRYGLGSGELATIILARHLSADLAIVGERSARQLAQTEGLKVMGCVGILEFAHRNGYVEDLRTVYEQMLANGTYIDRQILNQSLASFQLSRL
jgi:predicted nucleic acid-binding protein